jgi:DNA repair protein RecN (Recombination protein N)
MLRSLSIRHFAIIDRVELSMEAGFGVITGETGAGKSILIDALGLIIGGRADASMVSKGSEQADLSALFEVIPDGEAHQWLVQQSMDESDGSLIIRRTIQSSGGSRAWINGHPASASQLKALGALLVEIHGQHAHQQLSNSDHQRALLDACCPRESCIAVAESFQHWRQSTKALSDFETDVGDAAQRELLAFQTQELKELALQPGEFQALEFEQEKRQRHQEIQQALSLACQLLSYDEEANVQALLQRASTSLEPISALDPSLSNALSLLQEASINITEAVGDLEGLADSEDEDPEALRHIDQRLETALKLARKHRVAPDELPALTERLVARLDNLDHQDQQREQLTKAKQAAEDRWRKAALTLSEQRHAVAKQLSQSVTNSLGLLGMTHATLAIEVHPQSDKKPSLHGLDELEILFTANPGHPPRPLAKVASGGELSRVALALMLAIGDKDTAMTRVFDEVDAGIGGETAHCVGDFLAQLGRKHQDNGQALCVTHLPQVAARADHHFQVIKDQKQQTSIRIRPLDHQQRVTEIARMLGDAASKTSLAHAEELINAHRSTHQS